VLRRYIKIDTELLAPVEKDEIISEVARQLGVRIEPENLQLTTPLSALGEFAVPLQLPKSLPLPEGCYSTKRRQVTRRTQDHRSRGLSYPYKDACYASYGPFE
nr:50S ribosomal protein L9-like isoform X2 [Tanacetum cinerariifolium]